MQVLQHRNGSRRRLGARDGVVNAQRNLHSSPCDGDGDGDDDGDDDDDYDDDDGDDGECSCIFLMFSCVVLR